MTPTSTPPAQAVKPNLHDIIVSEFTAFSERNKDMAELVKELLNRVLSRTRQPSARTPGTVEVCKGCGFTEGGCFYDGTMDGPCEPWKDCTHDKCPLRSDGERG